MKLLRQDGTEVKPGDKIVDFREEEWTFIKLFGSKVYAQRINQKREFYPQVFNLIVEE